MESIAETDSTRCAAKWILETAIFSCMSPERRVPADHPLRSIKAYADAALRRIGAKLDELYGRT